MSRWLLLTTLVLAACRAPPTTLLLVLAENASAGSSASTGELLTALQAIPQLQVLRGDEGCRRPGASHELRVSRQHTVTTVITAAALIRCVDGERAVQNFVQPRGSAHDPSRAVAYWVARQLAADASSYVQLRFPGSF